MKRMFLALALVLVVPVLAIGQDTAPPASTTPPAASTAAPAASAHVAYSPATLKWGDAPPGLPVVAKASVLQGDPSQPGTFTVRLRFPANTKIMPHFHPTDENLTVISGTFMVGMGDAFDVKSMHTLPAGGFTVLPATMNHYAMAKTAAVVQIHGTGPFAITYVNPSDDPRNAPTAGK